jgi:biotin carboxylase
MVKVLILGVGNAQVDALRYLKEIKCTTHGLSRSREGRGLDYCDHFDVIDIVDKDRVLDYAKKHKVDAVYSVGSDVAMPTIGYVSEHLGLPYFCSEKNATLLNDKFLFRSFLKENNLMNIAFQGGRHLKDFQDWHTFPAMIKPVRSQGQRGIRRIENMNDIEKHIQNAQQFSASGEVILEEFISGSEVSANIFLKDGRILYSFISDRMTYEELDGGLVKSHVFPTKMNKDLQVRALQLISDTVEHLKILNGPIYFQMMYDHDDVHIIELTPRLDGCHIWRLIRSYAGIDLLKLTFDMLQGETILPETYHPNENNQGLHFFSQKPNMKFESKDFMVPEETKYHEFYYENGQTVRPLNKVFEKVGYYIK